MVRLALGPLMLELGVSRLKKTGLMVPLPMGEGAAPAVEADAATWAAIQQAAIGAVAADPVAREHLLERELKKLGLAR
jgi:hypothetical protein